LELYWQKKTEIKKLLQLTEDNSNQVPEKIFPLYSKINHCMLVCDNLIGMNFLKKSLEKFDFIYTDPPYNSGKELTYSDKFASTEEWLSFIYPRFLKAHELLKESGFLFVSIDDREMPTLSLLLREIFGAENHVGTIKWRKKRKPSFLDNHLSSTMEYILVFCKNRNVAPKLLGKKTSESTRPVLNASNKISERILYRGTEAKCADTRILPGYYENRSLGFELLDEAIIHKSCLVNDVRVKGQFRVSQEILNSGVFITKQFGLRRHVRQEEQGHQLATDDATTWHTNEDALIEQQKDFGKKLFDFAKPSHLIVNLLRMIPVSEGETFHCLDFFAGTGTLAKAIYLLEQEESEGETEPHKQQEFPEIRRRCVLIQNEERLKKGTAEFTHIHDLCQNRLKLLIKSTL
jgi:adenine-specific DNA-methyltransferase